MAQEYIFFGDTKGKFGTVIDTTTYRNFSYRLSGATGSGSASITSSVMEFNWLCFDFLGFNDTVVLPLHAYIRKSNAVSLRYIITKPFVDTIIYTESGTYNDTFRIPFSNIIVYDTLKISIRITCNKSGDTVVVYHPYPQTYRGD